MSCRISSATRFPRVGGRAFPAPASPNALLEATPSSLRGQPVYAYIVTTIETTTDYQLIQKGSAPNFDGERITLCTCKHKDRATFHPSNDQDDPWRNVWVAGFTSKTEDPSRSLAYLMCVERSFLNQRELWRSLPVRCRRAKSASKSRLGDVFEPKMAAKNDPYNPANYYYPAVGRHSHSRGDDPEQWHNDIKRWGRHSRPHRLLLGQTAQSYRWVNVKMILKLNVIGASAHHAMYPSLREFIEDIQEFDP